MQNEGKSEYTIRTVSKNLKHLSKHADLNQPDQVKHFIATKQITNGSKEKLIYAYTKYCQYYKIQWEQPYYKPEQKQIKIPTTEQLDTLIAHAYKKVTKIKLLLSKETGLRPIELCRLKVKDIDLTKKSIYPTTAKRGNPRILKLKTKLNILIKNHIIRQNLKTNDKLFKGDARNYGKTYRRYRKILAKNLKRPDLNTVKLYDFRHYYATRLYAKTRDILYVKQQLGHKRLDTTLIYVQLVSFDEENEYECKTANDSKKAKRLIEKGYEYVTGEYKDGGKLFRKRK